jgi:hypothetical protein
MTEYSLQTQRNGCSGARAHDRLAQPDGTPHLILQNRIAAFTV